MTRLAQELLSYRVAARTYLTLISVVPNSAAKRRAAQVFTPKALHIKAQGRERSERTLGLLEIETPTLKGLPSASSSLRIGVIEEIVTRSVSEGRHRLQVRPR